MDTILIILGAIAILVGIVGSLLPILPGPPLAWVGLLLLHFSDYGQFTARFLIITGIVTIIITVLDYLIPIWSTRRLGGTKAGQRGAAIGIILGFFIGPFGIVLGPLIGAFVGEMLYKPKDHRRAFKAALGSFAGFLFSTGIKLIWCLLIAWWFAREAFS